MPKVTEPPLSRFQTRENILATIWRNGRKLEQDGYQILPTDRPYLWMVKRPGERPSPAPEGGQVSHYYVKLEGGTWSCDCPAFAQWSACKHVIGCQIFLARCLDALYPAADMNAVRESLALDVRPAPEPCQVATAPAHSAAGRPLERRDPSDWGRSRYQQKQRLQKGVVTCPQ